MCLFSGLDCSQSVKDLHWEAGRFLPYKLKQEAPSYIKVFPHRHERRETRHGKDRSQRAASNDIMRFGKFLSDPEKLYKQKHNRRRHHKSRHAGRYLDPWREMLFFPPDYNNLAKSRSFRKVRQDQRRFKMRKDLVKRRGKRSISPSITNTGDSLLDDSKVFHQQKILSNSVFNEPESNNFVEFSPKYGFEYSNFGDTDGFDPRDFGIVFGGAGPLVDPFDNHPQFSEPFEDSGIRSPEPYMSGTVLDEATDPETSKLASWLYSAHPPPDEPIDIEFSNDFSGLAPFEEPPLIIPSDRPYWFLKPPLIYPTYWWFNNPYNPYDVPIAQNAENLASVGESSNDDALERRKRSALSNSEDLLGSSLNSRLSDDLDSDNFSPSSDPHTSLSHPLLRRSSFTSTLDKDVIWILGGFSFIKLPFIARYNITSGEVKPVDGTGSKVPSYRHGHIAVHYNVSLI